MEKKTVNKGKERELTGIVLSNKMDKTVRVRVESKRIHPRYKKVVSYRKVYFARTDKELQQGDEVVIRECRPLSKNVRWIVV